MSKSLEWDLWINTFPLFQNTFCYCNLKMATFFVHMCKVHPPFLSISASIMQQSSINGVNHVSRWISCQGLTSFFLLRNFLTWTGSLTPLNSFKHSLKIATKSVDESKLRIFKQFIVCLESCGGKSCSLEEKVLIANVELIFVSSKPL